MKIVFMGSALLSCEALTALADADFCNVCAVVTQPDRPRGRRLERAACVAKAAALNKGLVVLTPPDVNAPESIDELRALEPDAIAVVAYGQILKPDLLAIKPDGFINVHTSLLPRYRGAAPIQWAIANGETVTGVTTMLMDKGMDTGDILMQRETAIRPEDTAGTLHDWAAKCGAELLVETLVAMREGRLKRIPQVSDDATYAPKLTKRDGRMDWTLSAEDLYNRARAFDPWPVCWCIRSSGGTVRVWRARSEAGDGDPGQVLDVTGEGPLVAAGQGALRLLDVQPEGRKRMSGAAYVQGHRMEPGERFE